ncbi:MAG: hypothetical protein AAFY65_03800 [Pseudomonadota bacterium]
MAALVWIGALLTVGGLCGLGYCVVVAAKAKRQGLQGDDMAARLKSLVALNMAALGVSAMGLMMVVAGVLLG